MIKVVFVNPFDFAEMTVNSIPLGILSLATVLRNNVHIDAHVIDFHRLYEARKLPYSKTDLNKNINTCCDYLLSYEPDVVSFYTMQNTHAFAIMMAKKIKERSNLIKILLGGPQATLSSVATLKRFEYVDAIGCGDGESTIEKIILGVVNDDLSDVDGVCYRKGDQIIEKHHKPVKNMDELPIIDLSLLGPVSFGERISIDAGRGCPFGCSFCSAKTMWNRTFRVKSAERLFEEVMYYHKIYKIKNFSLEHDIFVLNKNNVYKFCDLLYNSNTNIKWTCSARIDTIDRNLLYAMSKAGCNGIYFGIESGSQRMQKIIEKYLDLTTLNAIIGWVKEFNITPRFSFIYGFPDESYSDIDDTLNLIYHIYNKFQDSYDSINGLFQLHKLFFYLGTAEFEKSKEKLVYVKDMHYDAGKSIDRWKNEELNEIVQDISVFPQYFELENGLRQKLKDLDYFMNIIFINTIKYYDVTYKMLLDYYDNSNLKLYFSFIDNTSSDILSTPFAYFQSFNDFFIAVTNSYECVINKVGINYIKNMFNFERDIFRFNVDSNDKEEFSMINDYEYDVLKMKKIHGNKIINKKTKLLFEKKGSRSKIISLNE